MRERVSKRKATPVQMELKSGSTSRSRSRSTNNTVCMCIKKLYRWCGTTQWLNRISKQNLNEHEHNKDNLQSKNNEKCEHLRFCEKRRNTMASRVLAAQHSTAAKKSCWHWQFLLDFLKKMKYLSSNFLVCARITHSHPVSFSRLGSFLCLCFYL